MGIVHKTCHLVQFKALPEGCARSWTKSEYKLLEYGLKHYSAKSVESIRKYFLPAKTTDSILAHIRVSLNSTCSLLSRHTA